MSRATAATWFALITWSLAGNTSELPDFEIVAHRGVHQPIDRSRPIGRDTCTAGMVIETAHTFVENTLPSIRAAFAAGATTVEMDLHVTRDRHLVVFHDWTLDCRTDGTGVTAEQDLQTLLKLDVGYGYTTDGGATHPLRGHGLRMPTLRQVLDEIPDGRLLLNLKNGSQAAIEAVVALLLEYPDRDLAFFCSRPEVNAEVGHRLPWLRVPRLGREEIGVCLAGLAVSGMTVPPMCRWADLLIPWSVLDALGRDAPRLIHRVNALGSRLYVAGVDTEKAARQVSTLGVDGVITDRIERVGPILRQR